MLIRCSAPCGGRHRRTRSGGDAGEDQGADAHHLGRDDRVTPLDNVLVPMRVIRNCEVHLFPDCGHWAMIERKAEFERVTMDFLTR